MAQIQVQSISKYFAEKVLFQGVSFQLEAGDKVALVGPNGSGKTTLLKCLVGQTEYDEGTISIAKTARVSYLEQMLSEDSLNSTLSEFLLEEFQDLIEARKKIKRLEKEMSLPDIYNNEAKLNDIMKEYGEAMAYYESQGGYRFESHIKELIYGLGFLDEDLERDMSSFSGGQKTKLYLARILLREPDILLLDEPTNYLDLEQVAWLESFFKTFKGTLLVVSHDRYFLDQVVNKVIEMNQLTAKMYQGSYSDFILQKELDEKTTEKEGSKQREKIKRLEEYIRKNKAGVNSKQAKGREKQLEKIAPIKGIDRHKKFSFSFQQELLSGENVLNLKNVHIAFGDKVVANQLNLEICRGERVGLIGKNGTGKTSLIRAILKELPFQGSIIVGNSVNIAYYPQEHELIKKEGTIFDSFLYSTDLNIQEVRDLLARFKFTGEDVYKKLEDLSGGEASRVILAKLFLKKANFLILDEPTNHLDIYARQSLEDALMDFPGTLFFISHDRYFLNTLATKIVELDGGKTEEYLGNYDYYMWKKSQLAHYDALEKLCKKREDKNQNTGKNINKDKKIQNKGKVTVEKIEKEISEKEAMLQELAATLGNPELYSNPDEVIKIQKEYETLEEAIAELYDLWETLECE
jgi:ATP-binding cassette subfamily F protein 3